MSRRSSATAGKSDYAVKLYEHGLVRLYDSKQSRLPIATQRAILELSKLENFDPLKVSRELGVSAVEVRLLAVRGIVQPRTCKKRRCACGALIVCEPCMTCESRRVHGRRG